MSQRSMEVKVGVLILVALGLLGGFAVVMGGLSLQPTFTVNIDFDNPGGLKPGAPVRIAGVKVGRVASVEFRSKTAPLQAEGRGALIRVAATLENQYREIVFENARWFVTTQGVLGELYLSVDPGTPDRPPLKDGAVVRGISPPRLDLLLSEAYELLHRAFVGVTDNEQKISETFDGLHRTLKGTGDFMHQNGGKLDGVVDDVKALTTDARDTLLAARERYVDSPQIGRILNDVEGVSSTLRHNLPPLLEDARRAAGDASRLLEAVSGKQELERYQEMLKHAEEAADRARLAARDAQQLIRHASEGKGTVGALLRDEAVYDDLQELLRDLKHNPWKFFWRE